MPFLEIKVAGQINRLIEFPANHETSTLERWEWTKEHGGSLEVVNETIFCEPSKFFRPLPKHQLVHLSIVRGLEIERHEVNVADVDIVVSHLDDYDFWNAHLPSGEWVGTSEF